MALYILDGLSLEMIARRFRTFRAEWAVRIWVVVAWAAAIAAVWAWLLLVDGRSARNRLTGQGAASDPRPRLGLPGDPPR